MEHKNTVEMEHMDIGTDSGSDHRTKEKSNLKSSDIQSFNSRHCTNMILKSVEHKGLNIQALDKEDKYLRVVLNSDTK